MYNHQVKDFVFVLVEHLIADSSVLHYIRTCHEDQDPMTELAKHNVPHLIDFFGKIPVSVAILVNFINVISTFVWNYMDIFIMIVSIGLSSHFKLLNNELRQATIEVSNVKKIVFDNFHILIHSDIKLLQSLSHEFWMSMRTQYSKLCDLVGFVDKRISHMVLLSFFNNLFFICRQLFESLRCFDEISKTIFSNSKNIMNY